MKRWRQFLALSLALLLLLPALTNLTPAQADEVEEKYYNGFTYMVRTDNTSQLGTYVRLCKYEGTETDLVIPEESWEQKTTDVDKYQIDVFVMGDDWAGKFDFLKPQCEVVYLPRTPEISTTKIKRDLKK